ncbi:MAG: ribosomal protein S18 acetylase RimI-like enzyme [Gammaproteobacteria bacterium]|jgi:ribosomal protein S18 acetylase RimI-like enzyme
MNIVIQVYRAERFAAVDALWREVFPEDPPWNRAQFAIPAKLAVQPDLFLLAMCGDQVVGTVMGGYDGHRGWVYALAVKPDHRQQGIATELMAQLETRLLAFGCVKLNLQVRANNVQVIELYQRLGYSVEDRISLGKRLMPPT